MRRKSNVLFLPVSSDRGGRRAHIPLGGLRNAFSDCMFEKKRERGGSVGKDRRDRFLRPPAPGPGDAETIRNEDVIRTILDNAAVRAGSTCWTWPAERGAVPGLFCEAVASVTGIDISPGMASRAREKFPQATVLCADAETYPFRRDFDTVMVYNALPHFPEPGRLIEALAPLVRKDGRLSVAHGMSRAMLARHHSGAASGVSVELPEAEALAEMFAPWFDVDVVISDDRMYQVAGRRR